MHQTQLGVAIAVLLGSSFFAANSSDAQLLVYEPFDYADGSQLVGQGSGIGFSTLWSDGIGGGGSFDDNAIARAPSLADPNSIVPTSGNKGSVQSVGGSARIFRDIDTTLGSLAPYVQGGEIGADGTTIYMSVLVKHGGGGEFMDDPPNLTQTNILEVGTGSLATTANGAFVVGIDAAGGSPLTRAVTDKNEQSDFVSIGNTSITPDLVVMRIDYAASGDTMSVYLNPTSNTTEPITPTGTISGDFAFNRIGLAAFQSSIWGDYDEIRIAGSYSDAFFLPPSETIDGDADADGDVDLDDFFAIRNNFFLTIPLGTDGDVSGGGFDGVVNLNDYVIWKRAFEALPGNFGLAPALSAVVPEPSTFATLFGCIALVGYGIRRRSA